MHHKGEFCGVGQCQVNKRSKHKYGKLPTKLVVTKPWNTLCVDLIGPYTLKGKDGTVIDFMCVTMINSATSWFEIVEYHRGIPAGTARCSLRGSQKEGQESHT
jgi:hypothetical protein